jgi:carbon storage regulator CsrA
MLVLSMSVGDKIKIGDNVTIHLSRVTDTQARIAFEAPKEVQILRENAIVRTKPDWRKSNE